MSRNFSSFALTVSSTAGVIPVVASPSSTKEMLTTAHSAKQRHVELVSVVIFYVGITWQCYPMHQEQRNKHHISAKSRLRNNIDLDVIRFSMLRSRQLLSIRLAFVAT